jgi:hypothetical protein
LDTYINEFIFFYVLLSIERKKRENTMHMETTIGGINHNTNYPVVLYAYRAALVLNNQAVSLLTHGLFLESMQTWKDAMRLMDHVTRARAVALNMDTIVPVSSSSSDGSLTDVEIRQSLDRAQRFCTAMMMASSSTNTTATNPQPSSHAQQLYHIHPAWSRYSSITQTYELLEQSPRELFSPLYIDEFNTSSFGQPETVNFDMHFMILLYNYGVAHHAYAAYLHHQVTSSSSSSAITRMETDNPQQSNNATRHYRIAMKVFQLAQQLVTKMDYCMLHRYADLTELPLLRVLLARSMVNLSAAISLEVAQQEDYCYSLFEALVITQSLPVTMDESRAHFAPAA